MFPFPIKLIVASKKFSKRLTEKPVTLTDEKKDLVIVLPFLSKLSLDLRKQILKIVSAKTFPFVKLVKLELFLKVH